MADAKYIADGFRSMAGSDVQGGTILFTDANGKPVKLNGMAFAPIPANAGSFTLRQELTGGGFSPRAAATYTIARADLPDGYFPTSSQPALATDGLGNARQCQINSITDCGPLLMLDLTDISEGA